MGATYYVRNMCKTIQLVLFEIGSAQYEGSRNYSPVVNCRLYEHFWNISGTVNEHSFMKGPTHYRPNNNTYEGVTQ